MQQSIDGIYHQTIFQSFPSLLSVKVLQSWTQTMTTDSEASSDKVWKPLMMNGDSCVSSSKLQQSPAPSTEQTEQVHKTVPDTCSCYQNNGQSRNTFFFLDRCNLSVKAHEINCAVSTVSYLRSRSMKASALMGTAVLSWIHLNLGQRFNEVHIQTFSQQRIQRSSWMQLPWKSIFSNQRISSVRRLWLTPPQTFILWSVSGIFSFWSWALQHTWILVGSSQTAMPEKTLYCPYIFALPLLSFQRGCFNKP